MSQENVGKSPDQDREEKQFEPSGDYNGRRGGGTVIVLLLVAVIVLVTIDLTPLMLRLSRINKFQAIAVRGKPLADVEAELKAAGFAVNVTPPLRRYQIDSRHSHLLRFAYNVLPKGAIHSLPSFYSEGWVMPDSTMTSVRSVSIKEPKGFLLSRHKLW